MEALKTLVAGKTGKALLVAFLVKLLGWGYAFLVAKYPVLALLVDAQSLQLVADWVANTAFALAAFFLNARTQEIKTSTTATATSTQAATAGQKNYCPANNDNPMGGSGEGS